MDSITAILHMLLAFLSSLATLIVNFLISVLQLLLGFINAIVGTVQ